jgi:hypothetical protein
MSKDTEDELAALKKKVEELEAKVSPPKSTFVPMTDEQWFDEMHRMREGNMRYAMPPSVVRYFADQDDRMVKEIALRDARAPNSPGMIPQEQTSGGGRPSSGDGSGWAPQIPLGPQPGIFRVDEQCIADDERQRAELKRKLGEE